MDELKGPVVAYALLVALVIASVVMGNAAEELGVTRVEFLLAVGLFTILPGILLIHMWRTT